MAETQTTRLTPAMQSLIVGKPYEFIPPRYSGFWHRIVRTILPRKLRKDYGVAKIECIGVEKLEASIAAGHGIIIAPNHCRPCDPMVLDSLAAAVGTPFHIVASWHVFMMSKIQRFLLPRLGGFSVHREGLDRESLKCAVNVIANAEHPLVIFPEGIITRANDRLAEFMDGTAFLARAAAKQRTAGKVVVHPVFIRYIFEGDLENTVLPVISEIEGRLSWQSRPDMPLADRVSAIGEALLGLKETEYFGEASAGPVPERLVRLQDRILCPLEEKWTASRNDGGAMARVKRLRTAMLPELLANGLSPGRREQLWREFADLYLVQQLHCYPEGYLSDPTPERLLETAERFEEDLTGAARPHFPIRAEIAVGDAIEVSPAKDRSRETDPLTDSIRNSLQTLLEITRPDHPCLP
jgi:1-acyl-sn-glycerol-3-phosphate acyltransferase